jgi:hypothetical protein
MAKVFPVIPRYPASSLVIFCCPVVICLSRHTTQVLRFTIIETAHMVFFRPMSPHFGHSLDLTTIGVLDI